ncbi:acetyl-CoA synthetase-like protein [Penicillium chermesinum]|nr:acetyl-CoA synthetase-like protein [Penicillium chermesinum]
MLYEEEIEKLYNDADKLAQLDATQLPGPGGVDDAAQVAEYVKTTIASITGWKPEDLSDEANWFNLGLDSLQTITATRVLKQGLDLPTLAPNVIYLNPTISDLTHALQNLHKNTEESIETSKKTLLQARDQLLAELVGKLKIEGVNASGERPAIHTVILTGSTGQLGTYLLNTLVEAPDVEHVYCLDCDERARDRQRDRRAAYGLGPLDESKVTFWKADLSQTNLGLQNEKLQDLQHNSTLIIHNARPVNFNISLSSFKPQLEGVVNLINFSHQSTRSARLLFISSISSVLGHRAESDSIREETVTTSTPAPNGYANSKYIAEHLVSHAAQKGLSRPAYARVGQVAGPIRQAGLWNKAEWFPSLVLSSLRLGALPDSLGLALDNIDWVPIDLLSEILVELAFDTKKGRVSTTH